MQQDAVQKVRVDKWLWAARFYKTRTIAKEAIEGGKVHCAGSRVKVSKEITIGTMLTIRQGFEEKTVQVLALTDIRKGAIDAQLLYQETQESIEKRLQYQTARKMANLARPEHKPSKKDRRLIHQFQQQWHDED